jgi:hypothetical protein
MAALPLQLASLKFVQVSVEFAAVRFWTAGLDSEQRQDCRLPKLLCFERESGQGTANPVLSYIEEQVLGNGREKHAG